MVRRKRLATYSLRVGRREWGKGYSEGSTARLVGHSQRKCRVRVQDEDRAVNGCVKLEFLDGGDTELFGGQGSGEYSDVGPLPHRRLMPEGKEGVVLPLSRQGRAEKDRALGEAAI